MLLGCDWLVQFVVVMCWVVGWCIAALLVAGWSFSLCLLF